MNRVLLSGRLTKDPDVNIRNGVTVTEFVLAVPRGSKPSESNFIQCVAFGTTATNIGKYCVRGMKIIIDDGEWRVDKYTDRYGNVIYSNKCWVKHFEFAESKSSQHGFSELGTTEMPFT